MYIVQLANVTCNNNEQVELKKYKLGLRIAKGLELIRGLISYVKVL